MPNQNTTWLNDEWQVVVVDSNNNLGIAQGDTLSFTSQNMIERQRTGQLAQAAWGSWVQVAANKLTGYSGSQPVSIEYDATTGYVTCYSEPGQPTRRIWRYALQSAFLGAVAGAGASVLLARFPLSDSLRVLLTVSISSLVTAARFVSSTASTAGNGPTVTWVATDGSSGRDVQAEPYSVVRATTRLTRGA